MTEDYSRMLGARDGLSHALISVRAITNGHLGPNSCYLPPKHHRRKRKAVLDKVAELKKAEDAIHSQLKDVMKQLRESGA